MEGDPDFVITTDEDIDVLPDINVQDTSDEIQESDEDNGDDNADVDGNLPSIDIDEWINLEAKWEKDTFFIVFTDEEIYQDAYTLFFQMLPNDKQARLKARIVLNLIKNTVHTLELESKREFSMPKNMMPVYDGISKNNKALGRYIRLHKTIRKQGYVEFKQRIMKMYSDRFQQSTSPPFIMPKEMMELLVGGLRDDFEDDEEDEDGGDAGDGDGEGGQDGENDDGHGTRTYVSRRHDQLPLPIKAVLKREAFPDSVLKSFMFLHEYVASSQAQLDTNIEKGEHSEHVLNVLGDSKWRSKISNFSKYEFDQVLHTIQALTTIHDLELLFQTHGFSLSSMELELYDRLSGHLSNLKAKEKVSKIARNSKHFWKPIKRDIITPSVFSIWKGLQSCIESVTGDIKTMKEEAVTSIDMLEANEEILHKSALLKKDIYDIIQQIQDNELTLEEVIETLVSIRKEDGLQMHLEFLKGLLEMELEPSMLKLHTKVKMWSQLDDSVKNDTTIRIEASMSSMKVHGMNVQEEEGLLQSIESDSTHEYDNVIETRDEPDASGGMPDISDLVGEEVIRDEVTQRLQGVTEGQREVISYVMRLLMDLQSVSGLPLDMNLLLPSVLSTINRATQYQELHNLVPEIPLEDIQLFFDQNSTTIAVASEEVEMRLKNGYKKVRDGYKKAVIDAFIFSITWWVIELQNLYIGNPNAVQPSCVPCLPVWAFYGPPMSTSSGKPNERGIANYLTCVLFSLKRDAHGSLWRILDGYKNEAEFVKKIDKTTTQATFKEKVETLKGEWKNKWKEVARSQLRNEVTIEQLQKQDLQPQKYLQVYVDVIKHLPKIMANAAFNNERVVLPVVNACCLQQLSSAFQPYADLQSHNLDVILDKRAHFFKSRPSHAAIPNLGSLQNANANTPVDVRPSLDGDVRDCDVSQMDLDSTPSDDAKLVPHMLFKDQWNKVCAFIGEPEWSVSTTAHPLDPEVKPVRDPIQTLSTSHLKKALNDTMSILERKVSNNKKQWTTFTTHLFITPISQKLRWLDVLLTQYEREKKNGRDWMVAICENNISFVSTLRNYLREWVVPADIEGNVQDLLNYIVVLCLSIPSRPSADKKSFVARSNGVDLEITDYRWLNMIVDNRLSLLSGRLAIQSTPLRKTILDYYANVREKLKVTNLEAYKSLSIDQITEAQDAKRLGIKRILDDFDSRQAAEVSMYDIDRTLENEGEGEFTKRSEDADDANEEALD